MSQNKPELLLPAGSLQKLKTAILYGADAVYCGTPGMSLRAKAKMTLEDVIEGVEFAHSHGKKVFLALNLFTHNRDIPRLKEHAEVIDKVRPDGVIVADVAVFKYMRENLPEIPLHVSTQSNVCSWLGVKFWEDMGAQMCVLAREVSFDELSEIRKKCPNIKLEAFIHGSMCMSYSGRCLLSNYFTGRGANQGKCAHCCRWNYKVHLRLKDGTLKEVPLNEETKELFDFLLEEELRPGDFLEIEETECGAYILNSKDLCLLPKLPEFLNTGVDCLKIEGRNKTQYYTGMVSRTYRKALDDYLKNPETWKPEKYMDELYTVSNRGFTTAFRTGDLTSVAQNYESTRSLSEYEFAGYVENWKDDNLNMLVKNKLKKGDELEFLSPVQFEPIILKISEFINSKNNQALDEVNGGEQIIIKIPSKWFGEKVDEKLLPALSLVRKKRKLTDEQKERIESDKREFEREISKGN